MSDTWNDRLKSVVGGAASKIPYVGALVKGLIDALWPASEPDIWTLIQDQVSQFVDKAILHKEIEERRGELEGLKSTMRRYASARLHEKGSLMSEMLGIADIIFAKLSVSSNAEHLLPFGAAVAHVHLTLLRERLAHGCEMYGENNEPVWKRELEEQYELYVAWLNTNVPKWKEWRRSQIEAVWYTTKVLIPVPPFFRWDAHGSVKDKLSDASHAYEVQFNSVETYFKGVVEAIRERLHRSAVATMASDLSSTFLLHVYLPGQEKEKPKVYDALKTLWLGPYSLATMGLDKTGPHSTNIEDLPGQVTRILLREWNAIDGLQFFYGDRAGNFIGNPEGGEPHDVIPAPGDYFTGMTFKFAKGIMCRLELWFSNGSTGPLGNRAHWTGRVAKAVIPPPYCLQGAKYRTGRGPGDSIGISVIELRFGPA